MQILKDEIREGILSAASEEFLLNGFAKASMRAMAERAGIGVSNIYAYFPNKEGIFTALANEGHAAIGEFMDELPGYRDGRRARPLTSSRDFGEFISARVIGLLRANRAGILLVLECAEGTEYAGTRDTLVGALSALFMENKVSGGKKGARKPRDASFIARILAMNLVQGFIEIARRGRDGSSMEENVRSLIRYHRGGMEQFRK